MRVLIADDHALFRDGLRSLLTTRGMEVVGEASDGTRAVEMAVRLRPDVVLMDLKMPGINGIEATRRIVEAAPEVAVVVLTASDDDEHLFDAIKSGAQGYLLKDLEADRFFALLEGVARQEPALTPALARKLLTELRRDHRGDDHPDALTDREHEVLELMVEGITSNRHLADRLRVSENTVKFHVRNILDKLHLHNRAQAVAFALRSGLIDPDAETG